MRIIEEDPIIEIRFAKNQKLPDGYIIIWDTGTEHYQWKNGDIYSEIYCDRWMAYRSAWKNFIKKDKMAAINNLK